MTMPSPPPPCAFVPRYHWPRAYRYEVAAPDRRAMWNRYTGRDGSAVIGAAVVLGRFAYCIKWADAQVRKENRP